MSSEEVLTPAGWAKRSAVRRVRPGETVINTPAGLRVSRPISRGAQEEGITMVQDQQVLTPGGWKSRSLVHHVPPGQRVQRAGDRLQLLRSDREQPIDVAELPHKRAGRPLQPHEQSTRHAATGPAPGLGEGWITYASWTNDTGTPVSSFSTTWVVPPEPSTRNDQTLFLFNGIQNASMIYQPVLQWGPSAAGGGDRWSVASWYADGQTGVSFHSDLVDVAVGDVLTGVMTRTGAGSTGHNYSCVFTGLPDTSLPIENVPELTWCIQTLEAYGVEHASDYPDTPKTSMRGIRMRCGATTPRFLWAVNNRVTDVGQHTVVFNEWVDDAGEVDLWYRPSPSWLSGFGSIQPGASQDWWFSWGGTGDVGPQLIQAEPVEPSGGLSTVVTAETQGSGGHLAYHATVRNDGSAPVYFQWRGGGR